MTDLLTDNMEIWARNQRLYFQLKNMGLHVKAVLCDDDKEGIKIDQIIVSVAPPTVPIVIDGSISCHVSPPVKGTEIGEVITSSVSFGDNVVDFPPKR